MEAGDLKKECNVNLNFQKSEELVNKDTLEFSKDDVDLLNLIAEVFIDSIFKEEQEL